MPHPSTAIYLSITRSDKVGITDIGYKECAFMTAFARKYDKC
jgi:hypothetical protein